MSVVYKFFLASISKCMFDEWRSHGYKVTLRKKL